MVLLIVLNYVYKYTLFEKDIQAHSPILNVVREVVDKKCEIVYVGESSNYTVSPEDFDKRSISDFVADFYPGKKFGDIEKGASHAGIYYELLRNIPENSTIKTVLVTLNLRSFDANWIYSNLETPLQKDIVLLKDRPPLLSRFLLAFKGYDIKTDQEREQQFKNEWERKILKFDTPVEFKNVIEWDLAMSEKGISNSDGSINWPLTELACHYVKTYGFQIDTLTNPRIKDFDRIVALAKKRNWNLVLILMAENIQKADLLVGKELVYLMKQNRDVLVERYNKNNVLVVDNLELVGSLQFIDQTWTTEHYAEFGRKTIAMNVAESMKRIYPDDFKNVNFSLTRLTEFSNNCEGETQWGQMSSLSEEQSSSGRKSSKIDKKNEYGITFEYPVKNLPDSLQQVVVNFQLFQTGIIEKAKFIIEFSGKYIEYSWNDKLIKDFSNSIQKWNEVNYVFPLPENFYSADKIKIYAHNPSDTAVYIDDVKIHFE